VPHPRTAVLVAAALAVPALASCTDNTAGAGGNAGSDDRTISVTSTDTACKLSTDRAPSGNLVFEVENAGSKVTEFYLYGEDGRRIVGEVENVGPGLTRDLVLKVPAGTYVAACKPGMAGKGIRGSFTVVASGNKAQVEGASEQQLTAAGARYKAYVQDQTDELLAGTTAFVAAYEAGDDAKARSLYAPTRVHWERIEPVAESFGDLDPRMDARQADLAQGQKWTGWHRIEKDLWPPKGKHYTPLTKAQRRSYADRLLADTETLHRRVQKLSFSVDQIGNGAKSLLDEVAKTKITGEEEAWSHTDLDDFAANVDGAQVAFKGLLPIVSDKDPVLAKEIQQRFADLEKLLGKYRSGDGYVSYTTLSQPEVRQLSDAVNALSEPLSRLTAAVAL
jgi:iron uptake system component EfeO